MTKLSGWLRSLPNFTVSIELALNNIDLDVDWVMQSHANKYKLHNWMKSLLVDNKLNMNYQWYSNEYISISITQYVACSYANIKNVRN